MMATESAEPEMFDALDAAEAGLIKQDDDDDSDGELNLERKTRRSRRSRGDKAARRREAVLRVKNNQHNWDVEDDDALYDVVNDDEYSKLRAERLEQDDFIVDDDGDDYGYRDHGGEIFDEEDFQGDSIAARKARRSGGGTGTRQNRKKMPRRRVNKLFTGGGGGSRLGAAVVKLGNDTRGEDDDDFLAEVLADTGDADDFTDLTTESISTEKDALRARKEKKKKSGLRQLAMFGSTDATRTAYLAGPIESSPGTIGSSHAGSPGKTRRTPPSQRTQFTRTPESQQKRKSMDVEMSSHDFEDPPEIPMDEEPTVEDVTTTPAPEPLQKKKKKVRTVTAMTEEELEAIENAPEGSKDHLKVTRTEVKTEEWQKVRKSTTAVSDEVKLSKKILPTTDMEGEGNEGKKTMRFFWMDITQGENNMSDTLFMFGKVFSPEAKAHVSCCVVVKNVERQIFVLPRRFKLDAKGNETDEKVEMMDVHKEMSEVMKAHGITSQQCKPVEREYAFERHDVPRKAEWLKFRYSAKFNKLPQDLSGKTFSHVFGTNIDPLERFIMKRKLMGPCWLDINDVQMATVNYSWCKLEAQTVSYKNVIKPQQQPDAPTLTVLSLRLQTILNKKTHQNEVLCVSGLVHNRVECDGPTSSEDYSHFTGIRKLGDLPWPFDFMQRVHQSDLGGTLKELSNERALLAFLMAKISLIDPDVIVGHNLLGFDLDVLLHRIKANSIPTWSKIGRLRRTHMPKLAYGTGGRANYAERTLAVGRMLVDVKISAREFVRQTSYEMSDLVKMQLDVARQDIDPDRLPQMFSGSESLLQLVEHVSQDALFVFKIMFKLMVIPLSKQITNITGGLLARTFAGGRSERNEYLLCHQFHDRKYIVPDKLVWQGGKKQNSVPSGDGDDDEGSTKKSAPRRKKAAYSGGLVLEPKKGFYDKFILLLDFNSLYPSIIQEYNLCFTTVKRDHLEVDPDSEDVMMADVPPSTMEAGILPKTIFRLIEKRKVVKQMIKSETDPAKLVDYDIRQKALKLTANSMYGCLGFTGSRFYAKPIAALITSKGREILQKTVDLAQEQLNLDVIYGDTDSIMINTRCNDLKEVREIGNKVKKAVNSLYTKLEIEIDGVFRTMLLLKKKKYAAITIEEKNGKIKMDRETKGLDMVRRDWSELSHNVGYYILNQILERESRESLVDACHEYLRGVAEELNAGKVPLEKFIIHKGLTKDPKQYPDAKHQPHVQVAMRMNAIKPGSAKALDTIPYVICIDGTNNAATSRAYHVDEMRKNEELKIDIEYYLKNQIHPVVARLMEPIEGTDAGHIAECLGLNASEFLRLSNEPDHSEIGMGMMSQMSDEERFKNAEKLKVQCKKCNAETDFDGVFKAGIGEPRCGLLCSNPTCNETFGVPYLCNKITLAIRGHISKYYRNRVVCDDQGCPLATTGTYQISCMEGHRCLDEYCRGHLKQAYTDAMLYNQIRYYQNLADVHHALEKLTGERKNTAQLALSNEYTEAFDKIYLHVNKVLERSAWKFVDLGLLFLANQPTV